jgi:sn-glycerol 3-phosphate transport system ATP-binding protein
MAEVVLRDLRKSFGATAALRGVSVAIGDGELAVVVGPSGSGKSTLLRLVAGLEEPSAGEVWIGGRPMAGVEPKDRDIAMVFQNYALYPHMTVRDNMAYGLKLRRLAQAEIRARVARAAATLGLDHLLERKPRQLSGGERQRVAMGRAIVREPCLFLFDEPLSNLDAQLRLEMRVEIKRLQRSLAATAIYVTHDQVEAMTLADRLIVMRGGAVEQIGAPLELYEWPGTVFVAGFIGAPAMNLLPALVAGDGGLRLETGALLTAPPGLELSPGRAVTLGVRPEHLAPVPAPTPLGMMVEFAEMLGADTVLHGRLPDGTRLVARLPGTMRIAAGQSVALAIDPARLHVFDRVTGQRL